MTISMTGGMNGTFIAHPINLLVHNLFGGTMSGYLRRIDFLNKENKVLTTEVEIFKSDETNI